MGNELSAKVQLEEIDDQTLGKISRDINSKVYDISLQISCKDLPLHGKPSHEIFCVLWNIGDLKKKKIGQTTCLGKDQ